MQDRKLLGVLTLGTSAITPVKTSPQTPPLFVKNNGFDSFKLIHDFLELLIRIASVLKTHLQDQAIVVGHTDSTGSAFYNQKLFERRAQLEVNKLIELEVTPTEPEWRAKNRRIGLFIPSFQFQE